MKFYLKPEDFFKSEFFRLKILKTFEDHQKIYIFPEEDRDWKSKNYEPESIINLLSEIQASKNTLQKMLEIQNLQAMIKEAKDFMKNHGKIYTSKYNTTVWRGDVDKKVLKNLETILPKGKFELLKNPVEIVGDGSCFYRSIAFSLFGTQDLCEHFRLSLIAFLLINIPPEISKIEGENEKLFIRFIKHNLKKGSWKFEYARVLTIKFIKRGLVSITDKTKIFTYTKYSASDKFTDIPICHYFKDSKPEHFTSLPSTYTQNQWDSFKNREGKKFTFEDITDSKLLGQELKDSVFLYARKGEGKEEKEISDFWKKKI